MNDGDRHNDSGGRDASAGEGGKWIGYGLALALAVAAFSSGMQIGQAGPSESSQAALLYSFFKQPEPEPEPVTINPHPELKEFWEVWELLEEKYVSASSTNEISVEERVQGAIDGLVDTYGDPYTVYLPPVDAAQFEDDISGEFSGVGMEVGIRDELVTIIAPLPDTPAEQAGLLAGDVIVRIDDVSTEDMRIDQAVRLIRGEKGSVVNLTIFREGELEFLEIPVMRDTISIPTIKTEQIDDTFVIALYSFNAVAVEKMQAALSDYAASGATSLVLDVRGNPGGFLQSAVDIAGFFLPSGKVVVKEQSGVNQKEDVFRTRGRQVQIFTPENLVVLVDNGSASASEILAGALQDHGVATVIGSNTFGKGSVQELVELGDGSSLKVTIARWLTPNGRSISDGGLDPDIVVTRTPAERLADIDPQKDAAIRFLAGEEVTSETFEEVLASTTNEENTGE